MTTTNKFAPKTRKALIKAMAEILGTKPTYLGMPSAAYEIGEYHLAKDGTMTGPDSLNLMVGLQEQFGISLRQNEEIRKVRTLGDVYAFFEKLSCEDPELAQKIAEME